MTATYKLIILFKQPVNPADFERRWSEEFVPLAERLPGLQRVVVAHTHVGPGGPVEIYLVPELHFASFVALKAAMSSEAGMAAGQCLVRLAPQQRATLLFAEHMDDVPLQAGPPAPASAPPPVSAPPKVTAAPPVKAPASPPAAVKAPAPVPLPTLGAKPRPGPGPDGRALPPGVPGGARRERGRGAAVLIATF